MNEDNVKSFRALQDRERRILETLLARNSGANPSRSSNDPDR
jgi:hypothetical protein